MSIQYSLLDVFADAPFQGTQIPVVILESELPNDTKIAIASEFKQTETVFVNKGEDKRPISVFNGRQETVFGAHTTLAASYVAHELGMSTNEGEFSSFSLPNNNHTIDVFIDTQEEAIGAIQFKRTLSPFIDRYTPELSKIADALNIEEKHIAFSRYRPMMVSVDTPILIVPFTKPEHILDANLNNTKFTDLLSELYASEILLFAPGTISGKSDFHGRLLNPMIAKDEFPPIGKIMPEFIAYLSEQDETAEGTHTFSIDRGSMTTRKSVLHVEFDKREGKETQCRIGGHVIKMGTGALLYPQ